MSAIFGNELFQITCCVMALLSCVFKVIQYAVLTMHILKIPLGFFKKSLNVQYFLRFSYEVMDKTLTPSPWTIPMDYLNGLP